MEGVALRDGVELWWESFGEPGVHNALLHSGAGDTADVFPRQFCDRLGERFDCVVRFDPRDAGRSTRTADETTYDQVAMADDLWAVADAAGLTSVTLIGYSGGGAIVQQAAVRQPTRASALVLLATGARPPETQFSERALIQLMTPAAGAGPDDPASFDADDDIFFVGGDEASIRELRDRMVGGRAPTPRSTERHL